jgi:hypothetical protein
VPTPAIGTFVDAESVSFPRSALSGGDNYFHVAAVNAMSVVGTVETVRRSAPRAIRARPRGR